MSNNIQKVENVWEFHPLTDFSWRVFYNGKFEGVVVAPMESTSAELIEAWDEQA